MFCKNRITLIGFIGKDANTGSTKNGRTFSNFSLATSVNWKSKDSEEFQTRTEWHRIVAWGKLADWAGSLKKGAFAEVEGELRYREFQPEGSEQRVRIAEIHANSILSLGRAEKADPAEADTPV
jgi:single-strand DNA-binding protein